MVVGYISLFISAVSAQEVEYDYRYYKFYKEDEDEILISLEDTISPIVSNPPTIARSSEYALRALNFRDMGERNAERYAVAHRYIDYKAARMLSQLKVRMRVDEGLSGALTSSPLYKTQGYQLGESYYTHDAIGVNISGRGSLGSLSYFGYHKPDYRGVLLDDGWEYSYAARVAFGDDLYIKGVYGDVAELSLRASYSDRRSTLNIIALLPYSRRGLRRASVEEAYTLLGDRGYNPLWGMYQGKVRNSREAKVLRPQVILLWDYRLTAATELSLLVDASYAKEGVTSLGWFDAPTPLPDNYHYLPSYHTLSSDAKPVVDAWLRDDVRYTQVDWEGLYHTNKLQRDGHARYVLESRREDIASGAIEALFSSRLSGVNVEYGVSFDAYNMHRYKVLDDLLGARYINNIDYFLVDDATYSNNLRNNLRDPNIIVKEGDTFGYNYSLSLLRTSLFGRAYWRYRDVDISLKANLASYRYVREGYYEKELYPGFGSYGRGRSIALSPYRVGGVVSYTTGNHLFCASVDIEGRVPEVDDLFYNPDYNSRIVNNPSIAKSGALKVAYGYVPSVKFSYTMHLFATHYRNERDVVRYYDDIAKLYVNGCVEGISRSGYGVDMRCAVGWSRYLSSNFRAVVASYRYADDAMMTLYADSDNRTISHTALSLKGCHWGGSEVALYGDLLFRHSGWQTRLSLSWCDGGYVEPAYIARSQRVLSLVSSAEQRDQLMSQCNLPSATAIDLSLARDIELRGGHSLTLRITAYNLLDIRWAVRGYESNRLRVSSNGGFSSIKRAADAISYSYPRTLRISANLWF